MSEAYASFSAINRSSCVALRPGGNRSGWLSITRRRQMWRICSRDAPTATPSSSRNRTSLVSGSMPGVAGTVPARQAVGSAGRGARQGLFVLPQLFEPRGVLVHPLARLHEEVLDRGELQPDALRLAAAAGRTARPWSRPAAGRSRRPCAGACTRRSESCRSTNSSSWVVGGRGQARERLARLVAERGQQLDLPPHGLEERGQGDGLVPRAVLLEVLDVDGPLLAAPARHRVHQPVQQAREPARRARRGGPR